jgi:hypothetical protein
MNLLIEKLSMEDDSNMLSIEKIRGVIEDERSHSGYKNPNRFSLKEKDSEPQDTERIDKLKKQCVQDCQESLENLRNFLEST